MTSLKADNTFYQSYSVTFPQAYGSNLPFQLQPLQHKETLLADMFQVAEQDYMINNLESKLQNLKYNCRH